MNSIITAMPAYYPLLTNTSKRYVVMRGGTGSGKTFHTYIRIISRTLAETPHIYLCLRKHKTSVRTSIWHGMVQLIHDMGLGHMFTFNRSTLTIHCKNGNQIWFGGVDDPQKLRSIEGVTSIWMEEADAFTMADFIELDRRFRAKTPHHKEIIITFNPVDTNTWMYEAFFASDRYMAKSLLLHTTYLDNPLLDPEVVEQIAMYKEYDPYTYRVFGLGEWGVLSGRIYDPFELVSEVPKTGDIYYGLDFGFHVPTACVRVCTVNGVHTVKEVLYERKLTTADIATRLKEAGVGRAPVYCDSADPASIEALHRAGINARPAKKDVKAGILHVKAMQGLIRIDASSDNLIKELNTYRWAEDKNGVSLDAPVKVNDHLCDAMRYAFYTHAKHQGGIGMSFTTHSPYL